MLDNFEYIPDENTSKEVWKYLASANLLEKVEKPMNQQKSKVLMKRKD